jgi:hypothetical protein
MLHYHRIVIGIEICAHTKNMRLKPRGRQSWVASLLVV